jgi:hypothetical protein
MVWLSFWYQYLLGGLIFLIGLWVVIRQGEAGFKTPRQRRHLLMLLGGFLVIFGLQLGLMLLGSGGG